MKQRMIKIQALLSCVILVLFATINSVSANSYPKYYIVSNGIADAVVITVHGWPDNKTPCESLKKMMNTSMEKEGNYHRFTCVDQITADKINNQ